MGPKGTIEHLFKNDWRLKEFIHSSCPLVTKIVIGEWEQYQFSPDGYTPED